ncbi:deaminase [Candidatus Similichlamydia laticola]|uniref:Putative Cytidine deaminase n=1 Tax=Candidatus Similichlamydia laticola TaxID=2170265 RepID=A0A369KF08_9BACT|nr:deaminase [Candidatus Similichlamydia laticola]RDB31477.1 putative Cytidine deaminase [Candidatus Similichlamydia laticola]
MKDIIFQNEILIGLAAPIGVPLQPLEDQVASFFKKHGFTCSFLKVSTILIEISSSTIDIKNFTPAQKAQFLQNAGDSLRVDSGSPEVIALLLIQKIRQIRESITGKHVIVIRSFKHPQEVKLMRHIYGKDFFLIGCSAAFSFRTENLKQKCRGSSSEEILDLIRNDRSRTSENVFKRSAFPYHLGKKVAKQLNLKEQAACTHNIELTFCLSDVFLSLSNPEEMQWILKRFLEAILGYPFHTPTSEEVGMFIAKTMALRSSAMPRQVGAVIMNSQGDVISTGSNEVPKHPGGFYWSERKLDECPDTDSRDFRFLSTEPARKLTEECCLEILQTIKEKNISQLRKEGVFQEVLKNLEQSRLIRMKLFEHRTVHAEMAALVNAAFRGVSVQNKIMYVTTFPCHECAKHLIAAGLREIVYLELYSKSEALQFWPTEVQDVSQPSSTPFQGSGLNFRPFVGVAPRRYIDIFSPKQSRETYFDQKDKLREVDATPPHWGGLSSQEEHTIREKCLFSSLKEDVVTFLGEMEKSFP